MRHSFPFLLAGDAKPVLVSGAGLSWGLIPMPNEIIRIRRHAAEQLLNANYGGGFAPHTGDPQGTLSDTLYEWAEEALDFLRNAGVACPKLVLARVLEVSSDPRWLAGVSTPITSLKPRHRVIARLAREGKWRAVWTFNWDCHIEAALNAVGIKENPFDTNQPWIVRYQRFLSIEDYGRAPFARTIQIHKPHGCVQSLVDAENQIKLGQKTEADFANLKFKIAKSELQAAPVPIDADYLTFRARILEHFSGSPHVAIGWRAAEQYVLEEFTAISDRLRMYPDAETRLSIIDPVFNAEGHPRLAQIYNVTQAQAHLPVESGGAPSVDTLMRWVQAIYTLEIVERILPPGPRREAVSHLIANLKAGQTPEWLLDWADYLVPAWVRLCWREGLVQARNANGELLEPDEVRLEADWHVPLSQALPERPELVTAAHLLTAFMNHAALWNFSREPGFAVTAVGQVIVLVPIWGDPARRRWLNSLRPLLQTVRPRIGLYNEICVLPVALERNANAAEADEAFKAVQTATSSLGGATGRRLRSVTMDMLSGGAL
jgi:hypothetical protein